jgi:tetratricopeptide (TPR) repeat protein
MIIKQRHSLKTLRIAPLFIFLFIGHLNAQAKLVDGIETLFNKKELQNTYNQTWIDQQNRELLKSTKINPIDNKAKVQKVLFISDSLNYTQGKKEACLILSDILLVEGKYDSALIVLDNILNRKKTTKLKREHIEILIKRGIIYYNISRYDSALMAYQFALDLIPTDLIDSQTAGIYNNRANVYSAQGNYTDAVRDYLKAARFYEQHEMKLPLAQTYDNIGTELANLNELHKSIENHQKAIKINTEEQNLYGLAQNYSNMGATYRDLDSIDLALECYKKSIEIAQKINSPRRIAQNLMNMGNIYEQQHDYNKSEELFLASLAICRESEIEYGVMLSLANLGNTNYLKQQYNKSENYLLRALEISNQLNLPKEKYQIFEHLAKLYRTQNRFEEAYNANARFYALKDSILSQQQKEFILDLNKRYETERKENQILVLERNATRYQLFLALSVILTLLFFMLFQRFRYLRKIAKRDKIRNQEQNEFLKEKLNLKKKEILGMTSQLLSMQEHFEQVSDNLKHTVQRHNGPMELLKPKINNIVEKGKKAPALTHSFDQKLAEANEEFYAKLLKQHPSLSSVELKICALLKLNLSTKEIANLTNRSIRTIDSTRNRIRRKLNLGSEENITARLILLDQS